MDTRSHDPSLIRRMQTGDLDAFAEFFDRYRVPVYRTALGLTGDRHAAEEVLQDTFSRAWRRREILNADVSPLPWLHRVALNLCYSRLGRRRLSQEPIGEQTIRTCEDPGVLPAERAERQELRNLVRERVAALRPKHQAVVALYYLDGLSLQETAEVLGIAVGTVKSRLHYALRSLRGELERDRRFGGAYGRVAAVAEQEGEG
jgi:RNA polymerase sigma-70 factor, ECF subfamily